MIVIFLLIPLSILIATGFLIGFIWAVRSGQYEDTCTPSLRMLLEDLGPRRGVKDLSNNEKKTNDEPSNTRVR